MGKLGSSKQHLPFYIAALPQLYIVDHHFQQMARIHFPEEKQIQFPIKKRQHTTHYHVPVFNKHIEKYTEYLKDLVVHTTVNHFKC